MKRLLLSLLLMMGCSTERTKLESIAKDTHMASASPYPYPFVGGHLAPVYITPADAGEVLSMVDGGWRGKVPNVGTVTGVTGTAPIVSSGGSAPAISIAGTDIASTGAVTGMQAQEVTCGSSTGTLSCASGATACGMAQASTSGATAPNLKFAPAASTNANGTPGSLEVDLAALTGSGTTPVLEVYYNGAFMGSIGPYVGGTGNGSLMLGNAARTSANYTIVSDGSTFTEFNGPSVGSTLYFSVGGTVLSTQTTGLFAVDVPLGGSNVPLSFASSSTIICGTGGTQTISTAQSGTPSLTVTTGTLSSACTLDFGTNGVTGFWTVDTTGAGTLGAFGIVFKNGTQSQTLTTLPAGGLVIVRTSGANRIAVN